MASALELSILLSSLTENLVWLTIEFTGWLQFWPVRVRRLVMRFLMEEIMVQIEKIHTDFWTFTVFDKFIKACTTRKNRYSGDQIRIYSRLSDFERDFGDFEEYGKIRDLYTDSKTPTKKVSV